MDEFDFDFSTPATNDPFDLLREKLSTIETLLHEGTTEEVNQACLELSTAVLEIGGLDPSQTAVNQTSHDFRALLDDHKAHECPVCLRSSKIYTRNINRAQVISMMALGVLWDGSVDGVRASDMEAWVRKSYPQAGAHPTGELGKLVHWGLVRQPIKTEDDKSGRTSGRWVPESAMFDFLRGKTKVPKYVKLLNNSVIEFATDLIYVTDEIPNFNFDELMAS